MGIAAFYALPWPSPRRERAPHAAWEEPAFVAEARRASAPPKPVAPNRRPRAHLRLVVGGADGGEHVRAR